MNIPRVCPAFSCEKAPGWLAAIPGLWLEWKSQNSSRSFTKLEWRTGRAGNESGEDCSCSERPLQGSKQSNSAEVWTQGHLRRPSALTWWPLWWQRLYLSNVVAYQNTQLAAARKSRGSYVALLCMIQSQSLSSICNLWVLTLFPPGLTFPTPD